ncbi:unnamed protein product [Gongylonema pulchrum]|uniref:Uncharacterized protein n=1 Tax=Gongylonema pulchrum TaxID=637853 RepID=A0A183DRA1_9BILA|nr:unnamed protein product [Gongylonema pulchrum]
MVLLVRRQIKKLLLLSFAIFLFNRILRSANESDVKMYVIGAYLLSANVVKITMIRKCSPPAPLQLLLEVNQSKKLTIPLLQHSVVKCPWFFAAKCDFVGYFALTSGNKEMEELISRNNKGLPQAFLLRTDKPLPQVPVPVKLHDARVLPDGPRKHKLAVCLQPVYLLADWTLLVQFFEVSESPLSLIFVGKDNKAKGGFLKK